MREEERDGGGGGGGYKDVVASVAETLVAVWAVMFFADVTGTGTGWYVLTSLLWGRHDYYYFWWMVIVMDIDIKLVYSAYIQEQGDKVELRGIRGCWCLSCMLSNPSNSQLLRTTAVTGEWGVLQA